MIRSLTIKNIALIDELHIEFGKGLNVLSGETGAGKSIIVDSMNLVTFRIFSIAIKRTPSETSWPYKEMIEQKDIEHDNRRSAYPPRPTGIALQKRRRTPSTTGAATPRSFLSRHGTLFL